MSFEVPHDHIGDAVKLTKWLQGMSFEVPHGHEYTANTALIRLQGMSFEVPHGLANIPVIERPFIERTMSPNLDTRCGQSIS